MNCHRRVVLSKNLLFCFFLYFMNISIYASSVQSLDDLKDKIDAYVLNELSSSAEGKVKVTSGPLDSRLNLKLCADDKLSIFNPYQTPMSSTTTMGIRCLEPTNRWALYVPVRVSILKTVLVAKRSLAKGTQIKSTDLYQQEQDAQKLKQGYFTDPSEVIGQVCKNNISPDTPLNTYNIELSKLVLRGEQVTIVLKNGPLRVSMDGIAMSDGVLGDAIKIKNNSSKRIIEAKVVGRKQVKVLF